MKRIAIIFAGVMLLVMSTGAVFAEVSGEDSVVTLANDSGLSLEGLRRDAGLFYEEARATDPGEGGDADSDAGLLTCHFTDGCGYAVNPQVMIDLQYGIVNVDDVENHVARNGTVGDRLVPNVMLGLHINF